MSKFSKKTESKLSAEVEELTNLINDLSSEQKQHIELFKSAMSKFATERSLDSCLEALNICIQLTNTRRTLLESYQRYSSLLENEITRINKEMKKRA
jgi:hypothetical protein